MESERIQLLKEIEGLKEEKVKKYEQRIKNQVEYSSDLKEQIAFQKEMKQLEQASNQLEIEMAKVRSIGYKFTNHVSFIIIIIGGRGTVPESIETRNFQSDRGSLAPLIGNYIK